MANQGCWSSPEQVLVGIRYSIGDVEQLIAGGGVVVHGREGVAVHGRVGVAVHQGHLGGLRKMVWVHRKTVSSSHTGQVGCGMVKVRGWGRVGDRQVGCEVGIDNPSFPQVFGYGRFRSRNGSHWVRRAVGNVIMVVCMLKDVRNSRG